MNDKLKKLYDGLDSMNSISKKIIKHGCYVFLLLTFISLVIMILNRHWLGNIYQVFNDSIYMFKTSFSILAIAVLGGLIFDYMHRKA